MINFQSSAFTAEERKWIFEWIDSKSSEGTKAAYSETFQQLLDFLSPEISLRKIELNHLQSFLKKKSHQSPYTQRRHRSALQSLYSFLCDQGYLDKNLTRHLKRIQAPESLSKKYLSEEEVFSLIPAEKSERNKILIKILYVLGLRICEVKNLKWKDIQDHGSHGLVHVFGKGGKSRSIPLSGSTWNDLKAFRAGKRDFEPVFTAWNDGEAPLSSDQIQQIVRKAALKAGITKPVSPHWLRHAHASHALNRKAPIHMVQATLGHASIATTGKYSHSNPEESSGSYLAI